jgi:hypothetical protein
MGGWVDGWVGVKAVLRIAYSNQKGNFCILMFSLATWLPFDSNFISPTCIFTRIAHFRSLIFISEGSQFDCF